MVLTLRAQVIVPDFQLLEFLISKRTLEDAKEGRKNDMDENIQATHCLKGVKFTLKTYAQKCERGIKQANVKDLRDTGTKGTTVAHPPTHEDAKKQRKKLWGEFINQLRYTRETRVEIQKKAKTG